MSREGQGRADGCGVPGSTAGNPFIARSWAGHSYTLNACAAHATALLACSRLPTKRSGSQPLYFPPRMNESPSTTRRAAEKVSASASSAVVSVSTPAGRQGRRGTGKQRTHQRELPPQPAKPCIGRWPACPHGPACAGPLSPLPPQAPLPASARAPGVLPTGMPTLVASGTTTLLYPTA